MVYANQTDLSLWPFDFNIYKYMFTKGPHKSGYQVIISYFSKKTYVVGTH